MAYSIESAALIDCGEPTDFEMSQLEAVANKAVNQPGYQEPGRMSRRILMDELTMEDWQLAHFAQWMSREYLDATPKAGTTAVVSMITDAEQFASYTQGSKAASNWHQDFTRTERGFFFPDPNVMRLIIPMDAGPLFVSGNILVDDPVIIEVIEPPEEPDREAALKSGLTVVGADGVLMKSEDDPKEAEIQEAQPGRIYKVSSYSVHKANPVLPEGRIFFQLDART